MPQRTILSVRTADGRSRNMEKGMLALESRAQTSSVMAELRLLSQVSAMTSRERCTPESCTTGETHGPKPRVGRGGFAASRDDVVVARVVRGG